MKIQTLLAIFALAFTLGSVSAHAAVACDEQYPFTALNGRKLVDCRVEGSTAKQRYLSLNAAEETVTDEDGGGEINGYVKKDDYNYCFTDRQRTVYQCSQTLDAASGALLPASASIEN